MRFQEKKSSGKNKKIIARSQVPARQQIEGSGYNDILLA